MHRRFTILFLSADKFPPFRVDVVELFARQITARGHMIDWVLQSQDAASVAYETSWEGGHVWAGRTDLGTSRSARLRKHLYDVVNDFKMVRLLRSRPYDIVQVKDKFVAALLAIWLTRRGRMPLIYWLSFPHAEASLHAAREGVARYPLLYWLRGWILSVLLYRIIAPRVDHMFVQSERMKRDLAAKGVDTRKMTPIPMGISSGLADACGSTRNEIDPRTVVYLGTLIRVRRIDFLVHVLSMIKVAVPEARLILVGDGDGPEDREAITEAAERLRVIDDVHITGFLPREEALEHVRRAGVCVSPFYPSFILNSTSPTKLVEYMAMGRPVVANDHPEQSALLKTSGGGLCVSYDAQAFSEAIIKILQDRALAEDMGAKGRAYVLAHRTYERIADVVEGAYARLMAEPVAS